MSEVKVSSITVELSDRTINLTVKDARELNKILTDLFKTTDDVSKGLLDQWKDGWKITPWNPIKPCSDGITWDTMLRTSTGNGISVRDYNITCDASDVNNVKLMCSKN